MAEGEYSTKDLLLAAQQGITEARGQLGAAVALLRECIGPLEVSAGLIESDDGDEMEYLIGRVRKFVKDASGVKGGQNTEGENRG